MAVRIVIGEKAEEHNRYTRCFLQNRIALGRSRSADICLPDMAVSTRHGEIRLVGNDYAIIDLGSVNGTRVQGKALVPHRPRVLRNGDKIEIAQFELDFRLGAEGSDALRDASVRQARDILSRILARAGEGGPSQPPTLEIITGPGRGDRFELPGGPSGTYTVGRSREADIQLPDGDVSRFHLEIAVEPDGLFVRDLGSRNGLYGDGEPKEEIKLIPGDRFQIGQTVLAWEHPAESALNGIFNAPEEATTSFAFGDEPDGEVQGDTIGPSGDPERKDAVEVDAVGAAPPEIGPADPLIGTSSEYGKVETVPLLQLPEDQRGNDLALILVGGLVVIGSVLGLIYFFSY